MSNKSKNATAARIVLAWLEAHGAKGIAENDIVAIAIAHRRFRRLPEYRCTGKGLRNTAALYVRRAARLKGELPEVVHAANKAARLKKRAQTQTAAAPAHDPAPQKIVVVPRSPLRPIVGDFLRSSAWRKLRYDTLVRYGAKCQCCGRSAKDGIIINVDHIKPRKFFPELALDEDNLQVLCDDCNAGKENRDMTDWRLP